MFSDVVVFSTWLLSENNQVRIKHSCDELHDLMKLILEWRVKLWLGMLDRKYSLFSLHASSIYFVP